MRRFPGRIRTRKCCRICLHLPHDQFDSIARHRCHILRSKDLVAGIGLLHEPDCPTGEDITKGVHIQHGRLGGRLIPFGPDKTGFGRSHKIERILSSISIVIDDCAHGALLSKWGLLNQTVVSVATTPNRPWYSVAGKRELRSSLSSSWHRKPLSLIEGKLASRNRISKCSFSGRSGIAKISW